MSTAHAIVEAPEQDVAGVDPDLEAIFREHYPTVYRTAYGVTGSAQDAEDVAQTVFLRLLHGSSAREWRNPAAYLYRAAVNESLTLIRSRRRHARNEDASRFPALAAHREAESADENHRRLYEAVAELGRKAAEILILRYVHEYSDAQIAKLLGTSRGTIAVSLYRSRARLRKLMRASSEVVSGFPVRRGASREGGSRTRGRS
jgi:RNA polymerase sigma-70 factor (ECF subfamily)